MEKLAVSPARIAWLELREQVEQMPRASLPGYVVVSMMAQEESIEPPFKLFSKPLVRVRITVSQPIEIYSTFGHSCHSFCPIVANSPIHAKSSLVTFPIQQWRTDRKRLH